MKPEFDAFIAYSSADLEAAAQLVKILEEAGIRVFFDHLSGALGAEWYDHAARGLESSPTMLILIGPHGLNDPTPRHELRAVSLPRAQREHYRIIPVLLPGAKPTDMPVFLRLRFYCDLREWDTGVLDQLIETLRPAPRVFLCHAKEDEARVIDLHKHLSASGLSAWFDKENLKLKIGASWRDEIVKAIEESDFFALCLSRRSVSKRGFVQNEIRLAVEEWRHRPIGSVYLLPIRLEPCEIPRIELDATRTLADLQWIDIYEADDQAKSQLVAGIWAQWTQRRF